jgi:integrase
LQGPAGDHVKHDGRDHVHDGERGEEAIVHLSVGNQARNMPTEIGISRHQRPRLAVFEQQGARITENTVRRTLYKHVRRSGLRKADLHTHDLRRTFGTWFLRQNPDKARELAELMGHSDLSQVMKYALSDEERARAG